MAEIQLLRQLLKLEEKEQERRWNNPSKDYKALRSDGILLYPIQFQKKRFGFADYPVVSFSFPHPLIGNNFKSGCAVSLVTENELIAGSLQSITDHHGEILLYTHDFPDFDSDEKIGIRLSPDTKTFDQMHGILKKLEKHENARLNLFYELLHGEKLFELSPYEEQVIWHNQKLNSSQQLAVRLILSDQPMTIVHGPPGTGKTTTLIEAIHQLLQQQKKVIVSAPSNAAVDHLALGLIRSGASILRLGNVAKAHEEISSYTIEGILNKPENAKQIKKLRQKADEYRRMASQYKRQFGKEEREQRQLLFNEVRSIQQEIRDLTELYIAREVKENTVILGTPVALRDKLVSDFKADYFILDEAGQCLQPLGWLGADNAQKFVMAGDPFQLPPTVISEQAAQSGLAISILECAFQHHFPAQLLNIQYRMPEVLIGFSSKWFYNSELQSANYEHSIDLPLLFIDTAGADFSEVLSEDGGISNPDELNFILTQLIPLFSPELESAFISPYAAQVAQAKAALTPMRCSTIDSFQGQECERIILSLVRSNKEGRIGFLSDYRRMNVAITRAQKQLIVIGDSTTLQNDPFFAEFIHYVEEKNGLKSVFEYLYS